MLPKSVSINFKSYVHYKQKHDETSGNKNQLNTVQSRS